MSAADLPDGTIVVGREPQRREVAYIKNHPTKTASWRGTDGGFHGDWFVDELIANGTAVVLRHGGV